MKRNFSQFENTDFLKGRCATHEIGAPCTALHNCVVRIPNLYGWKECSNNLLHNDSTIKVRTG